MRISESRLWVIISVQLPAAAARHRLLSSNEICKLSESFWRHRSTQGQSDQCQRQVLVPIQALLLTESIVTAETAQCATRKHCSCKNIYLAKQRQYRQFLISTEIKNRKKKVVCQEFTKPQRRQFSCESFNCVATW